MENTLRTEQEIERELEQLIRREYPEWFGSPWALRGKGNAQIDALCMEAIATREAVDIDECDRIDNAIAEVERQGWA